MPNPFLWLLDAWSRRYAKPSQRATVSTKPATVITGASEGIGLALARRFAQAGQRVVLVARREALLTAAADNIRRDFSVVADVLPIDINVPDAASQIEAQLHTLGLHTDILINNAGFGLSGHFVDIPGANIDALISCNIAALTRLTRHFLPSMVARQAGAVVNVASLAGLTPGPFQAPYYASKAYVISLTRGIAFEVRGSGVKVTVVTPGPIETKFHARMGADYSLYRYLVPSPPPELVADATFRGLRWHRQVIVPGVPAKLLEMILRFFPTFFTIPIVALILFPRPNPSDDK